MPAPDPRQDPFIRARIHEYLGAGSHTSGPCAWLHVREATPDADLRRVPVQELDRALASGAEIERPLWDEGRLLVHVDLEHVHFDRPESSWQDPEACFAAQEPALKALKETLEELGIRPLHLLSGRGHHLVWAIRRDSRLLEALAGLGRRAGIRLDDLWDAAVPTSLAEAFRGLGMVMEFLGHEVLRRCPPTDHPPLRLTAIEVEPGPGGREIVSLDLSEYGDPLSIRSIRVPFGPYLKPRRLAWSRGEEVPPGEDLLVIPLVGVEEGTSPALMRAPARAARLARRVSTRIPDQTSGTRRLLTRYLGSRLARIHRWHDSTPRITPGMPPRLPPCVAELLAPQARLLCPAGLQLLTRTLLSLGWSPRHIAQLAAARISLLTGSGKPPLLFDPVLRADFYVRLFAGLVLTGIDRLEDFNCPATQGKGCCVGADCRGGLEDLARTLEERCSRGWPAL